MRSSRLSSAARSSGEYSPVVDRTVVISTSGRSQPSTVSSPVELFSRKVPPITNSMRSVLLICTFCLAASPANSIPLSPAPSSASFRIICDSPLSPWHRESAGHVRGTGRRREDCNLLSPNLAAMSIPGSRLHVFRQIHHRQHVVVARHPHIERG